MNLFLTKKWGTDYPALFIININIISIREQNINNEGVKTFKFIILAARLKLASLLQFVLAQTCVRCACVCVCVCVRVCE